jgi:hypothetical protein
VPYGFELFSLFILILLGSFAWRYFRAGSLVGAMLGGRVRETLGEIPLQKSPGGFSSTILRVHVVEPRNGGEPFIGLAVTNKAPLGASMVPFRLTREQAREAAELLRRAAGSF